MVANVKKVQTLVNAASEAAEDLEGIATVLEDLRGKFEAQNVDATGTVLEGNVQAVSDWIDDIRDAADSAVTAGLIAARVPSHRGEAL